MFFVASMFALFCDQNTWMCVCLQEKKTLRATKAACCSSLCHSGAEKHCFHALEWSKKDLGVKQSSLTWKIFDKTPIAASSSSHDNKHELKLVANTLFVATWNGDQTAFGTNPSEVKCFQRGVLDLTRGWMDTKRGSSGCERISVSTNAQLS